MIKFFKIFVCFLIIFSVSCSGKQEEGLEKTQGMVDLDFTRDSKVYTLAVVEAENKEPYLSAKVNMLETFKKYGLIEGKNLKIIYHDIMNNIEKGKEILKQVVPMKPDVIFVNGTVIARAAFQTYLNAPNVKFVFACVTDPRGEKMIKDFDIAPNNNFTGVSYPVPVESRFQFIKEVFPNARKVAILHADMPQSHSYRKWVEDLIKSKSEFYQYEVVFRSVPLITGPGGAEKMTEKMIPIVKELNNKVDLFMAGNDQLGISEPFTRMVEKYAAKPFNSLSQGAIMKEWGGVGAIYPSSESMGVQSAFMIMKLLKGVPMEQIPAEQPKQNGFAFDLRKAKKWNVEIPIKFIELAGENIIR